MDVQVPVGSAGTTVAAERELSPLVMVRITHSGVVVPRLDVTPKLEIGLDAWRQAPERIIPVDRARLEVLAAVAGGADGAGAIAQVAARLRLPEAQASTLGPFLEDVFSSDAGTGDPERPMPSRPVRPGSTPPAAPDATTHGLPDAIACRVPINLAVGPHGFDLVDHDGWVIGSLSASEVLVASAFGTGSTPATVLESLIGSGELAEAELTLDQVEDIARRLISIGLLRAAAPADSAAFSEAIVRRLRALYDGNAAVAAAFVEARQHFERTGVRQPVVIAIDLDYIPMLSLGMLMAYAQAHEGGRLTERLTFAPLWHTDLERMSELLPQLEDWPTIVLFSHYVWNTETNLALSATLKELRPGAVTIHGGPSVPKYEGDAEQFFGAHPHVDVTVRGEGEITLAEALEALAVNWSESGADLTVLDEVPGLSYRSDDQRVVRSPERDRITELDVIPSPYLTGMFDHTDRFQAPVMVLETNRGCPYGCTFCDWGSNILSRIRKFDVERVKAEMEWGAQRGMESFYLADSNFGMLDRDMELVEHVVALKEKYGFPKVFHASLAKNRVNNLAAIVQTAANGGIEMLNVASVQSFDKDVLVAINRSNIKQERYDALIEEFRRGGHPIFTDIMVGIPGATVTTTKNDIQASIDRELHVRLNPTQLLVNSPMNAPDYRAEHGIVARPGDYVKQTTTFTSADWEEMMGLRRMVYFAERCALLRHLALYIRSETGVREVDFYDLVVKAGSDRRRWPYLAYTVATAPDEFFPPGSWWPVLEEFGRFAIEATGVPDDSALATAVQVQHALWPAPWRDLPVEVSLPHDYVAWYRAILERKRADDEIHPDSDLRRLRDHGPGILVVSDDDGVCERVIGSDTHCGFGEGVWELDSPVMRPKFKNMADLS